MTGGGGGVTNSLALSSGGGIKTTPPGGEATERFGSVFDDQDAPKLPFIAPGGFHRIRLSRRGGGGEGGCFHSVPPL